MLRTALATILLVLVVVLPAGSTLASEADYWAGDSATSGAVKKVLDFTFNPGEGTKGTIYCATGSTQKAPDKVGVPPNDKEYYSDVFYKRAPGSVVGPLGNQSPADPVMWDGPYFLRNNPAVYGHNISGAELWTGSYRPRVLPLLVAFNGKVYAARLYKHWYDAGAGNSNFYWWEWRVLDLSTCVKTSANTTDAPVLVVRGSQSNGSGMSYEMTHLVDGYLFTDGTNLYWGGGGGTPYGAGLPNAIQNDYGSVEKFGNGEKTKFDYVYAFNGTNWVSVQRGKANPVINDPATIPLSNIPDNPTYKIAMAMPNGYRMSHLIPFDAKYWDYYGSYGAGSTFNFTSYNPDVTAFTEPWGKFQMGTYGNSYLFRIIFNRKGDKNMIAYHAAGTATDSWFASGGALPNFFAAGINDGTRNHVYDVMTNPSPAPYWRACAGIQDEETGAVIDPDNNPKGYLGNPLHNGVYCTYSLQTAITYESGVYRYFPTDGSEYGLKDGAGGARTRAQGWTKVKSTNDARYYTGAIWANQRDGIYVGTSNGIVRRGIRLKVKTSPADPPKDDPGDPDPL